MGAVGNQAAYIRQLTQIMRTRRNNLTLEGLRADIDASNLPDALKNLAQMRLNFAAAYIDDAVRLSEVLKPGRLVIVDLRDEFIEKDEALGLFVVLLQIFSASTDDGKRFNKIVVFDEAHKYIQDEELIGAVVEVVREMRHKGTSVIVASQDPLSVPISLIELSSTLVLHKFNSPGWLKHIQKAITALANLTPEQLGRLVPGEAYVWAKESTDLGFTREAMKIQCRPRFSKHGGGTKTAVESH
jgi:DNA helicase HerA-like ATPase